MAGSLPGGALNALGTALIPETMARLQMPALIDQAKREQQVGNIQAGRLLGGADAEIGTPQTKSYQVNGRTIGQDNPSTIQPLFSPAKKMALFSQAMPEQARAFQAQQIQNSIAPRPLSKDDFIGEPGKGIFNIRTQALVPGTQPTPEPQKGVVVNNRFINPVTGELIKDYSDPKKQDVPSTKFAFDRKTGQNRGVTDEEINRDPANFAPPVTSPQVKLYNQAGQEIGTGDPNDPNVQARVRTGEVRTAPPRQFSGEQSKAAGFANDALTSEANVERLMNPKAPYPAFTGSREKAAKAFDPTGSAGWALSNYTASPEYQQYQQAKSNWGMAVLRQESGGAITPEEGLAYAETFFPKFGDTEEVVRQKKAQREQKVRGIIAASGGAYDANFGSPKKAATDGWSIEMVD